MTVLKRMIVIAVLALVAAFLAPVAAGSAGLAAAALIAGGLLLALVLQRALRRYDQLGEWVAIELNKLRRVYHLGRNLGGESRHRQWFTDLHGFLYGYLMAFDKKRFSQYQETNQQFRKLSYHLYQIPGLETEKERVLYRDLLEAAGEVAAARQRIQQLWNGGLPPRVWQGLLATAAAAALAIFSAMGPSDRFTAAFALTVLGGGVLLARGADNLSNLAGEDVSKRYVENIARLELKRDDA